MNIYIDESGSINHNLSNNNNFVVALIVPTDSNSLKRTYKRFISSNYQDLLKLSKSDKMFLNGKFKELKGYSLDKNMKKKFVDFFSKKNNFELYYIVINNSRLTERYCENTARSFNYVLKLALQYFISNNYLCDEKFFLQLDERNEKTETKYFLENYLNTELRLKGITSGNFNVSYFDSSNNKFIQIADVFANLLYSHIMTNSYTNEFEKLENCGILKFLFEFPLQLDNIQ